MNMQEDSRSPATIKQRFGEIEQNPIGLPDNYTKQIIQQMNTDLASQFTMFFQFKKQHWTVDGPDWKHIQAALDEYAKTTLEATEDLAERINLLGGVPISNPSRFQELSYVSFEGEDKIDVRTMLENDLKAKQQAIQQLRKRIQFVKENQDQGSDEILKDILEDDESIAHELHHYLKNESLEASL